MNFFYKMAEAIFGEREQYESTVWLRLLTLYFLKVTTTLVTAVFIVTLIISDQMSAPVFEANCIYMLVSLLILFTFRFYNNIDVFAKIFLTVETIYPFVLHFLGKGFLLSQGDFLWIIIAIITVILMFDVKFAYFYFYAILGAVIVLAGMDIYNKDYGLIYMTLPKLIKAIFNTMGLTICVFVPLSVFWPEMQAAFRQSQDLLFQVKETNDELDEANDKLNEANVEYHAMNETLIATNVELNDTLKELKTTQSLLVQSEKMASLGQLIAGIAHEINTPLGAIKASATVIYAMLQENLVSSIAKFRSFSQDEAEQTFYLIQAGMSPTIPRTTSELRKCKRKMQQFLEANQIADGQNLASLLSEMNILDPECIEPVLPVLAAPSGRQIIETAYQFITMSRGTSNILAASERVVKIVFALKSFAHYDHSGAQVLSNVTEGIEVVLTLYYNQMKAGIEIVRKYEQLPLILIYPDELNQVWTNLIHNAIQAIGGSGTLTITTKKTSQSVDISFSDTGCGIPEENIEKIFQPFFTTKGRGEGSGLGLDIANNIVKNHGGSIKVQSVVGKGSTFTVSLPLKTE